MGEFRFRPEQYPQCIDGLPCHVAGLEPGVTWSWMDVAVVAATRP